MTVRRVWNIPVTVADTRVGDADVSGRSEGGVTNPVIRGSGIARGSPYEPCPVGSRVQADGSGDSRRDGGLCTESAASAEELAGAEEIRCVEEIAGAMAIASVGCNI